jgi:hypothetical protein
MASWAGWERSTLTRQVGCSAQLTITATGSLSADPTLTAVVLSVVLAELFVIGRGILRLTVGPL